MLIPLQLILASSLLYADGDTTKKKVLATATSASGESSAAAERPATPAGAVTLAGTPESGPASTSKQALLGKAIGKSIANTARAVTPRASYLSNLVRSRAARGPALPPHVRSGAASVAFTADSIVVEKSRRTMTLYNQGQPVRIYFIALGQNPLGDKVGIGDNRTPEGLYYIEAHNPASKYYLSLRVSYPNDQDMAESRSRGTDPGGDIMIHGLPKGFEKVGADHRKRDWTNGCIAVTNAEIEEIWQAIPDGAAIHIKP